MQDKDLKLLFKKAKSYGATDFGLSETKDKRFYVIYNNKTINFGAKNGSTYFDHKDLNKRMNWRKRHSKIVDKDDDPVYLNKMSPEFWNWHLTW